MTSFVLAEVWRGSRLESQHTGVFAIADAAGRLVTSGGDVDRAVFPRSANKIIQALPLLLGGARDRFGLTDPELALACASHTGTALHTGVAAGMLEKAGRDEGCLECGVHWPTDMDAVRSLAAAGSLPTALHNNCSGKHAGFVCSALARGVDPAGYVAPDHAVMRDVTASIEAVLGLKLRAGEQATDGCSIPTFAVPVRALAQGFARLVTGDGIPSDFAEAGGELRRAVAANPMLVAGPGKFDTVITEAYGDAAFVKSGAEGVCCGAIPALGVGFAIKCDDGGGRGADAACASMLRSLLGPSATLDALADAATINWNGITVGEVRGALG